MFDGSGGLREHLEPAGGCGCGLSLQSRLTVKATQAHELLGSGVCSIRHIFHFEVLCSHVLKGHKKGHVLGTGTVESRY